MLSKLSNKAEKEKEKLPEYVEQMPIGEQEILRHFDNDPYTKAYLPKVA